jgi:hypothetical protein
VAAFVRTLDATLSKRVAEQKAPRAPDAAQVVVPAAMTPVGPAPSRTVETRPGG